VAATDNSPKAQHPDQTANFEGGKPVCLQNWILISPNPDLGQQKQLVVGATLRGGKMGGAMVKKIVLSPSGVVMVLAESASKTATYRIFLAPQGYGREVVQ
jgi:hypothetical protein